MDVEKLNSMKQSLDAQRDEFRNVYDNLLYYMMPELQDASMDRINSAVSEEQVPLDPTASKCAQILSSGLFSNTITMGTEFFGFRTNDEELNEAENVKRWFANASKTCLRYMQNSNYQLMSYECLSYYVSLCTGVLYTGWENDSLFYRSYPIPQVSVSEDMNGIVNTVFRSFMMTAQQAVEKWGDKNAKEILDAYKNPEQRFIQFPFYHAVLPRDPKSVKEDALVGKDMPFASFYVDQQNKHILEESGYQEFPYAVPRFQRTSVHPYGKGSAMQALPLARELDECRADLMDARQHKLQPTTWLPIGSTEEDIDNRPNAVNFYNPQGGVPLFQSPDVDMTSGMQEQVQTQNEVKELFFVSLFTALSQADAKMTATQVNAIKSEKAQGLSPIINRLYDEFFSPCIERTLMLLMRNGKLDDMPEELQGKEWTVEYKTRLDSLLDQIEVNSTLAVIEKIFNLYSMEAQVPAVGEIVDLDQLSRNIAIAEHADMDVIYSTDETEEMRAQRAEAQAQAQQAEAMQNMTAPVDMSKAPEQGSPIQQAQEQGIAL